MYYTKEQNDYIREIVPGHTTQEIADLFNERFGTNITPLQIKRYKSNHKLKSGVSNIDYAKINRHNKLLNDEQTDYLKSIYLGIGNAECARLMNERFGLNLTRAQIKNLKNRLSLNSGLTGRFEKGNNKYSDYRFKKGHHYSPDTEFKKGSTPKNWTPVGTEIVRSDGYVYIKVSDIKGIKHAHTVNWKQKHRHIWEEAYGPIQEGHSIIFLDGDKTNFELENLACIPTNELLIMNRNNLFYSDPELTKTGVNIAKLINKTNKINKKDKTKVKKG